jgi:hypothetical protein
MKQLNRFGEMIFRGQAMNFRGFGELATNVLQIGGRFNAAKPLL